MDISQIINACDDFDNLPLQSKPASDEQKSHQEPSKSTVAESVMDATAPQDNDVKDASVPIITSTNAALNGANGSLKRSADEMG